MKEKILPIIITDKQDHHRSKIIKVKEMILWHQ